MPRKLHKRWLPDKSRVHDHPHLRQLGQRLHDPDLWHLNRRSASGAAAVGLFIAWVPVPLQMLLSAAAAVVLRVNLPVAVAAVWVTNPITMPPLFWLAYRVGAWLLGTPVPHLTGIPTLGWLAEAFGQVWQPFLLGCLIFGVASAAAGYGLVHLFWRLHVVTSWRQRQRRRKPVVSVP
jgi:hypothetical protein